MEADKETYKETEIKAIKNIQNILQSGKPPFDYGNILLREYKNQIFSYFNEENPIPYEIEIQPSSKCNANCSHCWAKNFSRLEDKFETKENADIIFNKILNFKDERLSSPKIKFCGSTGDPLMNPVIDYIIDGFYGKRETRLFTNGIKIGQEKDNLKYLVSLSKLNSIYLSIDSGTTETLWKIKSGAKKIGVSIEDIFQGAKKIKEINNTGIFASYVITKDNYNNIVEASKKSKENKFNLIRFRIDLLDRDLSREKSKEILSSLNKAKEYEDETFKVIPIHSEKEISETNQECFSSKGRGLNCYTNIFWTCVGSNGRVYPCGHIVSPQTEDYGSLFENTFQEIWDGEKRKQAILKVPGKLCNICSPFSLTTNEIMTELLLLPHDRILDVVNNNHYKR